METSWTRKTESYGATLPRYTRTVTRGSRAGARTARSRLLPSLLRLHPWGDGSRLMTIIRCVGRAMSTPLRRIRGAVMRMTWRITILLGGSISALLTFFFLFFSFSSSFFSTHFFLFFFPLFKYPYTNYLCLELPVIPFRRCYHWCFGCYVHMIPILYAHLCLFCHLDFPSPDPGFGVDISNGLISFRFISFQC